MSVLKDSRCYLAGPIEDAKDYGVGWRQDLKYKSRERNLGIHYIDPTNKPANCIQEINPNGKRTIDILRENKQWEEMRNFVKQMRREDLRFTDIVDFLIVYINPKVHICGSYNELFLAEQQKKPLFCIIEGGIEVLPTWLFGVFKLENILPTVDKCLDRLEYLNNNPDQMDDCWVLVNKYLN